MSGDVSINVKESFKEEFKGKQEIGFVSEVMESPNLPYYAELTF